MSKPRTRSSRELTPLTEDGLQSMLDQYTDKFASPEHAVLHMMQAYRFNVSDLRNILQVNRLEVSFSNVSYTEIAPLIHLKSELRGKDIASFPLARARLPTVLLKEVVVDIDVMIKQYGLPDEHENETAHSRFLSPIFNRIVAQFDSYIGNTPEALIEGRLATRGRIEYHFRAFGSMNIIFIEVKLSIGLREERMNCIAQLIAEADACDYTNYLNDLSTPIYGILCDGSTFQFFCFDQRNRSGTEPLCPLTRGSLSAVYLPDRPRHSPPKVDTLTLSDITQHGAVAFIRSLRPIFETYYWLMMKGFCHGLESFLVRSKSRGVGRKSTASWTEAYNIALKAMESAVNATDEAMLKGMTHGEADVRAMKALELLKDAFQKAPGEYRCDSGTLMESWDDNEMGSA